RPSASTKADFYNHALLSPSGRPVSVHSAPLVGWHSGHLVPCCGPYVSAPRGACGGSNPLEPGAGPCDCLQELLMKRISVIAAAALAVLAATGAHARSLDVIQKDGTLRVATEGYYAPFAYFEGKKLTGFEVDLTELMTQKMGLKLEWKTISFDALLTGLK